MATSIMVSSAQLRTRAEEIDELNQQFKARVNELVEKEGALKSMYEGDAANAFHNTFNRNRVQMDNFYNCIARYSQVLLQIAAQWEQTEALNQNTAATSSV